MTITLYRYTTRELFSSFLLGLAGFTFILLTGRILQLAELFVNKGIPLSYILRLLYFLLPSFLFLTIPMATLLAVLLTFNRLSGDQEILALKASGVSLYQMAPPVLVFSGLAYLGTMLLSLYALPHANEASRSLLYEMASSRAQAGVKERVFNDDFEGLVLYVDRVAPRTFKWENIFICDSSNTAQMHTILAQEGVVFSDPQRFAVTLRMKNGAIHHLGSHPEGYQKIDFDTYDLRLDLKTGWKKNPQDGKHPADMSLSELGATIHTLRAKNADVKLQLVKVHEKFSIPFACLIFGIIGIPLGLQSRGGGRGKSRGFAWSIGVLLVYYLLTNAGVSLAERGVLILEAGMWAANTLFLFLGVYLFIQAANESPVLFPGLNRLAERLRQAGRKLSPPDSWGPPK